VGGVVGRIAHPASKIVIQTSTRQLVADMLMFASLTKWRVMKLLRSFIPSGVPIS
jgi:hypothetical protein